jgi:hypothetical protein
MQILNVCISGMATGLWDEMGGNIPRHTSTRGIFAPGCLEGKRESYIRINRKPGGLEQRYLNGI